MSQCIFRTNLVTCLLCLFFFLCGDAHSYTHANATPNRTDDVVRIGYFDGFGLVQNKAGKQIGYLADLIATLDRRSPDAYTLVPLANNDIHALLDSGEIDIFALTVKTSERMNTFAFSTDAVSKTQVVLVSDGKERIYRDDVAYMSGRRVAVLPGIGLEEDLYAWLRKNSIPMDVVVPRSIAEFLNTEADFHLTTVHYLPPEKKIVSLVKQEELYFMSMPKRQEQLHTLQKTLAATLEIDATLLQRLHDKYILPLWQNSPFLTRNQMNLLRDVSDSRIPDVLTAFAASHAPLQYVNTKGQPDGITVSILKILAKKHPSQSEYVAIETDSNTDVSGFDVLCTIIGNRKEKQEFFLESDPYLTVPMELVTHNSLPPTKRNVLGMLDYSSLDLDHVRSSFPQWQLETFQSFDTMYAAYEAKAVNGLLLSSIDASYVMNIAGKRNNSRLQTSLVLPYTLYIAKKLHPESINITNAFIKTLDPLEVNNIVLNELDAFRPATTFAELVTEYDTFFLALVGIALLAGFGLHLNVQHQRKNDLQRVLHVDALTGLASKRRFVEVVNTHLALAKADEYLLASFDIDNFSTVNQNYGFDRGNDLLVHIAKHIKNILSSAVVIARQKDDVFLVFLRNYGTNALISHDTACTSALTQEARRVLDPKFSLSMSFGCYVIHDPKMPTSTMLDYCNVARQAGKSTFGFVTTFFTEAMQEELRMHAFVLGQMKAGIDNKEFFLLFQPKVELQTRKIIGAEALVRWNTEKGIVVSPQHFIPIFEKNGFITPFDYYVFEMACQFIAIHSKSVFVPPIAVNLSGHTVLSDDTPNTLKNIMRHYGIVSAQIEIEITESAIITECERFVDKVNLLKNMGFTIALDDFGTGVSSLNRLRSIPLDVVKLDKDFLDANMTEGKGVTIVDSIVTMLQHLHIKVVAEGVETIEHADWLTHIGCDVAQGYYFSKPVRGDIFFEILKYPSSFDQLFEQNTTEATTPLHTRPTVTPARASVDAQANFASEGELLPSSL